MWIDVTSSVAQPPAPAPSAADTIYAELPGLYELSDGSRLQVFDLVDQLRSHQLVALDPATGDASTLFPTDTALPLQFTAGAGWFVRQPSRFTARFRITDTATTIMLQTSRGTVTGTRMRFRERELTFRNGDVTLSGTLISPPGPGPHPAIVMVHGSGPLTRRVPTYIGELLAARGVATLVYDKRGTGKSSGQWQGTSHEALARDVEAILDTLLRQPDVDPERVGLFGSSEGGYLVPMVAARRPEVRLLVCRVCPALPHWQVAPDDQRSELRRMGFTGDSLERAVAFHTRMLAYVAHDTGYAGLRHDFANMRDERWMQRYRWDSVPPADGPYWRAFRGVMLEDPRESYRQLRIPVLIAMGERDDRIDLANNRPAFLAAGRAAGNSAFHVEVFEGGTHGMLEQRLDSAGRALPFKRFVPRFHEFVVSWIARQFGIGGDDDMTEVSVAMDRVYARFVRAYRMGSVDSVVALYTESPLYLPGRGEIRRGRDELREQFAFLDALRARGSIAHVAFESVERGASGDLAYDIGYYALTVEDRAGRRTPGARGKFATVWRRNNDGAWRIHVDSFSPVTP